MIYIDIIATNEPDSIEVTGKKDHKWVGLHDAMSKPKIGLFQFFTILRFLNTAYGKLNKQEGDTEVLAKGEVAGEEA